ncbi:MAG: NADPH-dependent FMN reductase [Terriglobales bacterium]
MPTIIGLAESVRRGSHNAALLRAAIELAPSTITIETESIAEIPLYNGDVEAQSGIPEPVRALKDRIAAAQAAWLPVVRVLGMRPWFGRTLYVANAGSVFDKDGRLVDDQVRKQVAAFMAGFAEFVLH